MRSSSHLTSFVHPDLHTCTHVFIRHDATKPPLQPTYNGPYKVLERKDRHFVVELSSTRKDTVCIDRLKPAYLIQTPVDHQNDFCSHSTFVQSPPPQITPQTPSVTRSGRHVRFPSRYM